jgi:hypothetical protein
MLLARFNCLVPNLLGGVLIGCLTSGAPALGATDRQPSDSPIPAQAAAIPPSGESQTYDQIVRLSLVAGDVRVARGKQAERATGGDWGQATSGLPIEEGFSLATGVGRAEIEFEDASTAYLGENSVLTFDTLSTTNNIPHTELTLVSGTLTLHVQPTFAGEWFGLGTPTDRIAMRFPDKVFVRVSSYLDAMSITPLQGSSVLRLGGVPAAQATVGTTFAYRRGQRIFSGTASAVPVSQDFSAWDLWVASRVAARDAAMASTMKSAGLTAPIPGLVDLDQQGTFFDCAPYGKCWEPTNGWTGRNPGKSAPATVASGGLPASISQPASQNLSGGPWLDPDGESPAGFATGGQSAQAAQTGMSAANPWGYYDYYVDDDFFPCSPELLRYYMERNLLTGRDRVIGFEALPTIYPYNWAVCHAGTWITRNHRYLWVVDHKRHHHPPIHWVKTGRSTGFVPIHPRDVAGKPPLNLKEGIFTLTGAKGEPLKRIDYDPGVAVKVLESAPKEFLKPYYQPLQRAETPKLVAHALEAHAVNSAEPHAANNPLVANKDMLARPASAPIAFDHKSQSFVVPASGAQAGHSTTVAQRFGGTASYGGGGSTNNGGNARSASGPTYNGGGTAANSARSSGAGSASYSGGNSAAASHSASSPAPAASAPAASAPSGGGSATSSSGAHK